MTLSAHRIQLRRTKGWRMPPNTVKVDRTTVWGNPFVVGEHGTHAECMSLFSFLMLGHLCISMPHKHVELQRAYVDRVRRKGYLLRGRNLACWCAPDKHCHADVLLLSANKIKSRVVSWQDGKQTLIRWERDT